MSLDEIVAGIDKRFHGVDGPPRARCPTGEPYVCLVVGGERIEGQSYPEFCKTEQAAIDGWRLTFEGYAVKRGSRLYWRQRPEVNRDGDKVIVYSRLIITDKPELPEEP